MMIFIGVRIIKEMSCSVASGTRCIRQKSLFILITLQTECNQHVKFFNVKPDGK